MSTEDLVEAAKRFRSAERTMVRRRDELVDVIKETFADPENELSKSDIARITGYTREHVSRLIDPPKKPTRRKRPPKQS